MLLSPAAAKVGFGAAKRHCVLLPPSSIADAADGRIVAFVFGVLLCEDGGVDEKEGYVGEDGRKYSRR